MIKLQDFAAQQAVTDRQIQRLLKKYAEELDGMYERRGQNGTWLSDGACDILRSKMKQSPAVIFEEDPRVERQQKEIEDLRSQLKKKDEILYGLIERNEELALKAARYDLLAEDTEREKQNATEAKLAADELEARAQAAEEASKSLIQEADRAKETAEKATLEADRAKLEAEAYKKYAEDLEAYLKIPALIRIFVKKPTFDSETVVVNLSTSEIEKA